MEKIEKDPFSIKVNIQKTVTYIVGDDGIEKEVEPEKEE